MLYFLIGYLDASLLEPFLSSPNSSLLDTSDLQPFENDEQYLSFVEWALNLQRVSFEIQERSRGLLGDREKERDRKYLEKLWRKLDKMAEKAHLDCELRAEKGAIEINLIFKVSCMLSYLIRVCS